MNDFFQHVLDVLRRDERFFSDDGTFLRNAVFEAAMTLDTRLLTLLLEDDLTREKFFTDAAGVKVFDKLAFAWTINNRQFLPDSYTRFANKIGLADADDFISATNKIALVFPYKDCVLEGGQTRDDIKRDEIFYNTMLAPDAVDCLLEPKVLVNATRYTADGSAPANDFTDADNLIVKGNNLLALASLTKRFTGRVKLIYIDPPYNTGSDSFGYNDRFRHSTWLTFMTNRLNIARELLSDDGSIFIQIDANEMSYLKVLCDEIFERTNFVNMISVRAKFAGLSGEYMGKSLQDSVEYILVYAKDITKFFIRKIPQRRRELVSYIEEYLREGKSWKYTSVLSEVDDGEFVKEFNSGSGEKIKLFRHNNFSIKSVKQIADEKFSGDLRKAYYAYIDKIFRTTNAQTSIRDRVIAETKIFGNEGLFSIEYVPLKGKNAGQTARYFYKDDNLIAWLKDVVQTDKGIIFKLDSLGTLWDDIQYNNLTKEGGVQFPRGKKPELLVQRVLEMATNAGDLVLDYHVGSGTTAAVAHKMGRRYIGVEQMNYIRTLTVERLVKVIGGEGGGISGRVGWTGGGSFVYCELASLNQKFVDAIECATDNATLSAILKQMLATGFISHKVDPAKIEASADEFAALTLDGQKRFLLELLDKNLLYVNLSDLDDAEFAVADSDKQFTRSFYFNSDTTNPPTASAMAPNPTTAAIVRL